MTNGRGLGGRANLPAQEGAGAYERQDAELGAEVPAEDPAGRARARAARDDAHRSRT